ncbi:polysaccharide deacetylase family protein [Tetrasphaera sp. F2B08]|uniref:polysaccharide deacetylase family protein n=1 Tax=Nostocoides sp. F2B08 TaxID=2653936 RepID=UPI001D05A08F
MPVNGDDIVAALTDRRPLPKWSVWFTFDDGLKSTLDAGETLAKHGIQATAFINPSTYERPSFLWFQILDMAESQGVIAPTERAKFSRKRLKECPDAERRAAIHELDGRLDPASKTLTASGSLSDLRDWVQLGHEVGNHTWDHPCLDNCDGEEQRRQVERAHEWLVSNHFDPRFFAYPNGNWSSDSEGAARRLGYSASVLFDHHLERLHGNPHMLSRLRISDSASRSRSASILSGAHSGLYHAARRLHSL